MEAKTIISFVETQTLGRELSSVERWVFEQTWQGQSYIRMAQESSYSPGYLKVVGAKLWADLSDAVQTNITKKNLRWVLRSCLENHLQQAASPANAFSLAPALSQGLSSQQLPPQGQHSQTNALPASQHHSQTHGQTTPSAHPFIPFPSGPVALDSPLYIERTNEQQAYGELQTPGCLLRLHGPSKTGKTSLLLRLLNQAELWNYSVIFIDFQTVERSILSDLDLFLRWFCANVIRQHNPLTNHTLASEIESFWDDNLGAGMNCTDYLEQMVLAPSEVPIVLALNEVNQAMSQPEVMQDFLSLLRFWHEQSKHQDLWKKLRLILVYSTECYVPLRIDRSPFNVGFAVKLPSFTPAEVQTLAIRYGFSWANGEVGLIALEPLITLVGGNPYLIQLAFHALHETAGSLDDLMERALLPDGPYYHHLRERAHFLEQEPALAKTLHLILEGASTPQIHPREIYHLESAGLIRYEGKQILPSCELYRQFFQESPPHR